MLYQGEFTKEISFPLGGIGSGSIGLDGAGRLVDWEIFNHPDKGRFNGCSHFAIKAATSNKGIITKVLNGDLLKDYSGLYNHGYGHGADCDTMGGFSHFKKCTFAGTFPIASITFSDPDFPAEIVMRAFNPMIPLDEDNSSIPGAFFEIEIHNTSDEVIEYQTALSVRNPFLHGKNEATSEDGFQMLSFINTEKSKDDIEYGDLTIATDSDDTLVQSYWYRGGWKDSIISFWNNFNSEKDLCERLYEEHPQNNVNDYGTLASKVFIVPGESRNIRFILTWNIPNNYAYWQNVSNTTWKNYYAVLFENSKKSAAYSLKNWDVLKDKTIRFTQILHRSSLDTVVIDAISSTMSVLKSSTVLRLEDGSFYGWEGVNENTGSCEGTCQHVWNYAYALCFLFPRLERSIRENEFKYTLLPSGQSIFRMKLPLELNPGSFRACVDGQMGMIIKSYREWKISGDDQWLKDNWNSIKLALDYANSPENEDEWDKDSDGVLEGRQHHTLDMELFGPSSWLEGMYLTALKAGSEMAEYLGEHKIAKRYADLFENGKSWTKENLFNGRYFIQKIDVTDRSITDHFHADNYWNDEAGEIKYQIADGCAIDQLLGQWHAHLIGLGEIFDHKQVDTALDHMYEYLYKPSMRKLQNFWRVYSINDEAGSIICDYPKGSNKPYIPIPYSDETMTGFEYAFAGLLILYGKIEKGLSVIRAVRDRYDGKKRNPYNELECGSNYARAMSSFALLPIFSGFSYDLSKGHIGFNPLIDNDNFCCFFSLGTGWGEFQLTSESAQIELAEGILSLCSVSLPKKLISDVKAVQIDNESVDFSIKDNKILFERKDFKQSLKIGF